MRRSTQIVVTASGFMFGITAATYWLLPWSLWLVAWLIVAMASVYYLRRSWLCTILLFLVGVLLGIARQDLAIASQPLRTLDNWQYQKVVVSGRVVGEPYWDAQRNFVYYITDLRVDNQPTSGQLRIKSLVGNAKEGYVVQAQGKLLPTVDKYPAQISYARVAIVSTARPPLVEAKVAFSEGLRRALPEPAASFMLGILIGARSTLPKDLQALLAVVGLSHLVAVSGYNLTIITSTIQRGAGKSWQWGGLMVSLWLTLGFVVLTGGSASIVRAGVMSTLFLLARYYGRRLDTLACVALGAVITLGFQPSYLLGDLSWQLSFLALTGIVLLAPTLAKLIPKRFGLSREIISVTLAAQLATLPLIALTFGQVSLVAPLANIVIMPFVPLLMLIGVVVGLIGMLLPNFAYSIMQPVAWLVATILDGLRYLGSLRWSALNNAYPSFNFVVGFYGFLVLLGSITRHRTSRIEPKNAILTDIKSGART